MLVTAATASAVDSGAIETAARIIRNGGIVSFPTETVYGLGADAGNPRAVARIFEVKARPRIDPIIIHIADFETARIYGIFPEIAELLMKTFWPGPLTLVVHKRAGLPANLSLATTIGVRIPDHPFALSLLRSAGPLATTSANLSGKPEATTAREVFIQLAGRVELILDGGPTPGGAPSTVVDCTGEAPKILREGPILAAALRISRCS